MIKVALSLACVLSALVPANAQQYPNRAVEIIVPFAAGGGNDLLARMIGEGLGRRLGQSFVPLNRPGANTNNGTAQVVVPLMTQALEPWLRRSSLVPAIKHG